MKIIERFESVISRNCPSADLGAPNVGESPRSWKFVRLCFHVFPVSKEARHGEETVEAFLDAFLDQFCVLKPKLESDAVKFRTT